MTSFMAWFVLPSLCTMFIYIQAFKIYLNCRVGDIDCTDWGVIITGSLMWPLGVLSLIGLILIPVIETLPVFLTKERCFRNAEDAGANVTATTKNRSEQ